MGRIAVLDALRIVLYGASGAIRVYLYLYIGKYNVNTKQSLKKTCGKKKQGQKIRKKKTDSSMWLHVETPGRWHDERSESDRKRKRQGFLVLLAILWDGTGLNRGGNPTSIDNLGPIRNGSSYFLSGSVLNLTVPMHFLAPRCNITRWKIPPQRWRATSMVVNFAVFRAPAAMTRSFPNGFAQGRPVGLLTAAGGVVDGQTYNGKY